MNRQILVGMAAAFVGLTALLVVTGIVVHPLLLAVAVPFGVVAYLLWYHATGRLHDRVRRQAEQASREERERARRRARSAENKRAAYGAAGATGTGGEGGGRYAGGSATDRAPSTNEMSRREAYDTLGLDPSADEDAVRTAYRERAKRLHPDSEGGDEEAFKELTEAYDVLKS